MSASRLDDAIVLAVLEKMVKQRRDSISQFEAAQREDLAAVERYELGVIHAYLPAQARRSRRRWKPKSSKAIAETGAQGRGRHRQAHGRAQAEASPGKADMGQVSALVKKKLAG
jgi:uncharacterized protein YqeY